MATLNTIHAALLLIGMSIVSTALAETSKTETENSNKHEMHTGETMHSGDKSGEMAHSHTAHGKMKHNTGSHAEHMHHPVDVSSWPAAPSLTMTAYKDLMSGWNLHIMLSNFTFAPGRVNLASAVGEGHAHLYVNGKKITRLYSEWYYLNDLPVGTHTVTVTLNANDHGPLTLNGETVAASVEIVQQ